MSVQLQTKYNTNFLKIDFESVSLFKSELLIEMNEVQRNKKRVNNNKESQQLKIFLMS